MSNYYFLGAVLPELVIDMPPDIQFQELMTLFRMNLNRVDLEKVVIIRTLIDLENIRWLLLKKEIDPRGNLTEKDLDKALLNKENLPKYVFQFFGKFDTTEDRLKHFSTVIVKFFSDTVMQKGSFLKFYLNFEREWRLMMVGYRAKKIGRDLIAELQYEELTEPFVAEILAQKDTAQFKFPYEYEDLGQLLSRSSGEPLDQYQLMLKYRFDTIGDYVANAPFSIDKLLAYLVRLMLVNDWHDLDDKKGKELLNQIVKESV